MFKAVAGIAAGTVAIVGLGFATSYLDLAHYSFFAPKFEEARHEVYKNSTAFVDGTVNAIADMQMQYANADSAGKSAIAATVRHRFVDIDYADYPPHLKSFLNEVLAR